MSTQELCSSHFAIYIDRGSCVSFGGNFSGYAEGFNESLQLWTITDLSGHPKESIKIVATSVFARLPISAEHKYKMLKTLPRPSTTNTGLVAFYPNDEKKKEQRLTVIKPGRFLRKVLVDDEDKPLYSDTEIEKWANLWITEYAKIRFHLLSTGEDIREAYEKGPSSCMVHPAHTYQSNPYHPCEVYGEGWDNPDSENRKWIETDTRLAVIFGDDTGKDDYEFNFDKIIARCVVIPEKKTRSTVYGDRHKLEMLLDAEGYNNDVDAFKEARLRRIECNKGTVCPYFDFGMGVNVEGDHLIVSEYGDGGGNQNGLMYSGGNCCDCGCNVHEDDEYVDDYGDMYCEYCFYERYFYDPYICEYVDRANMVEINGTITLPYSRRASLLSEDSASELLGDRLFYCNYNDKYYSMEQYEMVITINEETIEYETFFKTLNGFHCAYTDEYYNGDDYKKHTINTSDGETMDVVDYEDAGIDAEDYVNWLIKNSYFDEEFKQRLEEKQGELL